MLFKTRLRSSAQDGGAESNGTRFNSVLVVVMDGGDGGTDGNDNNGDNNAMVKMVAIIVVMMVKNDFFLTSTRAIIFNIKFLSRSAFLQS